MFDFNAWMWGLAVLVALGVATWLVSLPLSNASIVDSMWSIFFVAAAFTYAATTESPGGARRTMILILVTVWGLRLSGYITSRNWGHGEDKRYQAMRAKQGPNFAAKSLGTVFMLQALLAWVVSLPLLAAVDSGKDFGALDAVGLALWAVGFVFEAGGDYQLARFKARAENRGKVMDRGLWRFTRHPNYFGDFTQWWAFFLIALAAGGWWSLVGPVVMSWLLLKVSGVTLLERTITTTRPGYADYVARTNAFFPGPRKRLHDD